MKDCYRYFILFLILSFSQILNAQSPWYKIYENSDFLPMRGAMAMDPRLKDLFAVGDQGMLYETHNYGFYWDAFNLSTESNLKSIASNTGYSAGPKIKKNAPTQSIAIPQFAIICGEAGTLIRYDLYSRNYTLIDTLTTEDLNIVVYDFFRNKFWLAGNNGFLASSEDLGQTWQKIELNSPLFNIKKITFDYNYLLLWGDDGNTVYIKKIQLETGFPEEFGTDSIANHTLINLAQAGGEFSSQIYFVTRSSADTAALWNAVTFNFPEIEYVKLENLPFNDPSGLAIWNDYATGVSQIFATTLSGQIWKGNISGVVTDWYLQFEDPSHRALGPVIASDNDYYGDPNDAASGVALGNEGMTVFNGFVVLETSPPKGDLVPGGEESFSVNFSNIPEISSLSQSTIVKSNFSGVLPVNFFQDDQFPNLIHFMVQRPNPAVVGGLPGEKWNITFDGGIFPNITDSIFIKELAPFQFNYSFVQGKSTNFEYTSDEKNSIFAQKTTTNWVTAFFNDDAFLDLATYAQDSLIIYLTNNETYKTEKKFYFPGINVNSNLENQLKILDVNHDALPDLLLFDDTHLILLINNSHGLDVDFYQAEASYSASNIKDIIPYNEDKNSDTDLMILSDDISIIMNISATLIDLAFQSFLTRGATNVSKIQVGDINGDFVPDLVYLSTGNIVAFLGDSDFGLREVYETDTLAFGEYVNFSLADLDRQAPLEIIALNSNGVDAISYINRFFDETNYIKTLFSFNSTRPSGVLLMADDFGGNPYSDHNNLLDIALVNRDSLFIFQNLTTIPGNLVFSETPIFQSLLARSYNQIFTMDYESDFIPEIVLVNRFSGTVDFWRKGISWLPQLFINSVNKNEVKLSWTPFPTDLGTLDYYELQKSLDPNFEYQVQTFNINDTLFVDHDVWPFEEFWYRVKAVYDGGQYTEISDPVSAKIYREISGNISGVLADTTLPYLVTGDLIVSSVDSLLITNGVELAFRDNTGMQIYGRLSVRGLDEQKMVNFYERDSLWQGIRLYQNSDTAYFEWFTINGAKTGIVATERPFKMRLGGITNCETALLAKQLDFWMENILIDSVFTGIMADIMVNGFVKNIDILHARDASVFASGMSTNVNIKNAIIWGNLGPVAAADSARIFIDYSTVDNIGKRVFAQHISKLPPLFSEDQEGDPFQLDPMSPTIDAGDPSDPYDLEPEPNGGRINQGTLGNTPLATPSLQPRIAAKIMNKNLKAFANEQDSTLLFIKNWGYIALNVDSLVFKNTKFDSVFVLEKQNNFTVAPQDSVPFKLWFKPPQRGDFSDSLVIFCNDPHLLLGRYLIEVHGTGLNSKPILLNEPPTVAFVDSLYLFKPQFYDLDGDTVLIRPILLPEWLKLSSNGELTGTPVPSDTGKHLIRLQFDDQHGGIDSLQYVVQVVNLSHPVALFPVVKAFPVGGSLSRQAAINIAVTVFDSTQNKLKEATKTYQLSGQLFKEGQTEPLEQIDTSGVRNIVFYPLADGDYKFILRAGKTLVSGQSVEGNVEIPFRIKASQKSFARFKWHMVTYPRHHELNWATFEYGDSAAVLYRWDAGEKKYYPIMKEEMILPGWAFWLMPLRNVTFDLNSFSIATPEQQPTLEIKLKKGWNQIGLPWPYYKRWINMRFARSNSSTQLNINQAIADTLIQPAAFWFEQSDEFIGYHVELFDSTAYARPWLGYWLYANTEATMFIDNRPEFSFEGAVTSSTDKLAKAAKNQNDWLLNFSLQSEKLKDDFTMVGLSNLPSKPILEPPVFNEFTSLSVTEGTKNYCRLLKPWFDSNKNYAYWDLTVTTSAIEKEHRLSWQQLAGQNQDLFAYLVDLDNEAVIKLWEKKEYIFTPETNVYHFRLYVSNDQDFKPSIIPLRYSLSQNFPNPFNPTTTIKIGVPETGAKDKISVRVYDVLGKEIRVLFDGHLPPGFHKFEWDGTNATGDAVASGIYFYQLRAGQVSIMKKMVLLR